MTTPEESRPEVESMTAAGAVDREISPEALAAVRDLALRAYPETVPELVGGDSIAAVLSSVEAAAAAYQRIAETVAAREPAPAAPVVPAGSAPAVTIDPDRLPPVEKIRRALAQRG